MLALISLNPIPKSIVSYTHDVRCLVILITRIIEAYIMYSAKSAVDKTVSRALNIGWTDKRRK